LPITNIQNPLSLRSQLPGIKYQGSLSHAQRDGDSPMNEAIHAQKPQADQPLVDTTPYGSGKDDSVSEATDNAAITHHAITISGATIPYTARCGHLVTTDQYSARPVDKILYVAFTANIDAPASRPVTFFYNGGPGSSSVFLLLGSFGPRCIRTSMPHFTHLLRTRWRTIPNASSATRTSYSLTRSAQALRQQ
jgi:carboxypeptidase C (cathepsin A)